MTKIFFKNVGRSLLTSIITLIPSTIFALFIIVISEEILRLNMSLLAMMIIEGVATLVSCFLWMCVVYARHWDWYLSGKNDYCRRPPHLIFGILMLLLIFLAFGGVSALVAWLGYDKFSAVIAENDDYKFTCLLSSVTVSQLCYFLVMIVHYGKWQICLRCGHMFCFDYYGTGESTWDTISYKTYTNKEKIGTISAGDRAIADIAANVTHGYTETTHYSNSSYSGGCRCCKRKREQSILRVL